MPSGECALCAMPRILMACSACGQRACSWCYDTRHALCATCAQAKGHRVRVGPHMF